MPDGSQILRAPWPLDVTAEWNRRTDFMNVLADDPDLRDGVRAFYRTHCLEWINDWCVTYDPRVRASGARLMPLRTFKRQDEFVQFILECFSDKESGLVEKSRDMGASWLCCCIAAWLFIFHPGSAIGFGSYKSEKVDKSGDMSAILPKVRKLFEFLPTWMLPAGFDPSQHANYMRIAAPQTNAIITGEAGDNVGRGGRTSIYFKDESAHYEHPELVEAALGDNTDVQIDISSVNGSANVFYRRRIAGEVWTPGCKIPPGKTRVFIFDWRDHPAKTQAWYDLRRQKAEDEGLLHVLAQEVDRDYAASVEGIIIPPQWVNACIDADKVLGIQPIGEKLAAQDIADGGGDRNAYGSRHGVIMKNAKMWGGEAGDAARIAVPMCIEDGVDQLYYDSIGVGAGFKTEINTMKKEAAWPQRLKVFKWDAGMPPLNPKQNIIPGDKQSPTNEDQYYNIKAQGWMLLRARCYKTFKAVEAHRKGLTVTTPHSEMIAIPADLPHRHQLVTEMSQPRKKHMNDGRLVVDKSPEGAASPNLADMTMMLYHPARGPAGFFDV